mmetsp:Transcript_18666/g.26292  ORF Transcript_18666/g.26292 Transcript_18666/m.26292 type:complete len:792 (-) Transcript_18666:551-2926(-)
MSQSPNEEIEQIGLDLDDDIDVDVGVDIDVDVVADYSSKNPPPATEIVIPSDSQPVLNSNENLHDDSTHSIPNNIDTARFEFFSPSSSDCLNSCSRSSTDGESFHSPFDQGENDDEELLDPLRNSRHTGAALMIMRREIGTASTQSSAVNQVSSPKTDVSSITKGHSSNGSLLTSSNVSIAQSFSGDISVSNMSSSNRRASNRRSRSLSKKLLYSNRSSSWASFDRRTSGNRGGNNRESNDPKQERVRAVERYNQHYSSPSSFSHQYYRKRSSIGHGPTNSFQPDDSHQSEYVESRKHRSKSMSVEQDDGLLSHDQARNQEFKSHTVNNPQKYEETNFGKIVQHPRVPGCAYPASNGALGISGISQGGDVNGPIMRPMPVLTSNSYYSSRFERVSQTTDGQIHNPPPTLGKSLEHLQQVPLHYYSTNNYLERYCHSYPPSKSECSNYNFRSPSTVTCNGSQLDPSSSLSDRSIDVSQMPNQSIDTQGNKHGIGAAIERDSHQYQQNAISQDKIAKENNLLMSQDPIVNEISNNPNICTQVSHNNDYAHPQLNHQNNIYVQNEYFTNHPSNHYSNEDPTLQNCPQTRETKVRFNLIEIREYERILGDNPSCSSGPSVSIGWNYEKASLKRIPVDDYEYYRITRGSADEELVLTRQERVQILMDLGYTRAEIADAIRQNIRTKNKRRQTVNNLAVMKFEEFVEVAGKKLSKIFTKKSKKKNTSVESYIKWKKEQEKMQLQEDGTGSSINSTDHMKSSSRGSLTLDGTDTSLSNHQSVGEESKIQSILNEAPGQ